MKPVASLQPLQEAACQNLLLVRHRHLDRVEDRALGLRFDVRLAAVPELGLHIGGIDHGRRIAGTGEPVNPFRYRQVVGETLGAIMTGRATDLAGAAETLVVEQLVTESHLGLGLWIVWGNGDFGQSQWCGLRNRNGKQGAG